MQKLLKLELFPGVYRRFPIESDFTIGREEGNQIVLSDRSISAKHARIGVIENRVWIEDLGSTNGTMVNNILIQKKYLEQDDIITIGYAKILFAIEEGEPFRVDISQETIGEPLKEKEDLLFLLFGQDSQIAALRDILSQKMQAIFPEGCGKFLDAIDEALNNAVKHGNRHDGQKKLQCWLRKIPGRVLVTIHDEGEGFDYEKRLKTLLKSGRNDRGIPFLIKETDGVEYNLKGNEITLVKKIKHPVSTDGEKESKVATTSAEIVRYVALRYCTRMIYKRTFPLKMIVSAHPIKSFPDHLEMSLSPEQSQDKSLFIKIMPVCPGCLVTPPWRKIDVRNPSIKVDFWITPLSKERESNFYLSITRKENPLKLLKLPFQIFHLGYIAILFFLAFLIPFFCILMDVPVFPINRNLPAVIVYSISIVRSLGGLTICGLLAGFLCLVLGSVLYYRFRPISSPVIYDQIIV